MDNGLLHHSSLRYSSGEWVLILIVMDNGLLPGELKLLSVEVAEVLILIVMDNGLLQININHAEVYCSCLNPYCNG